MKKLFFTNAVLFFSLFLCSTTVSAQEDCSRMVSVGLANGKAVKLVLPEYSPAAKAVRASGEVNVAVIINEKGSVISAKSISGHPLLQAAAEKAALESKFTLTKISEQIIKVCGVIVYNFISNKEPVETVIFPGMKMLNVKTKNVGVINGRAKSLPKPDYPPAAKAVRAGGAVSVEVLVDEQGNVTSATAVSGHPLLRQAAEKAAMEAKFSPFSEMPVTLKGIVVYNFVLPKKRKRNSN